MNQHQPRHSRFDADFAFITYDPQLDDTLTFDHVYGDRSLDPELILSRAHTLSQQGRWDRMRSYLAWELNQHTRDTPGMEQVHELHRAVRHVDSVDQLVHPTMASARLRHQAGRVEEAAGRLGTLLNLLPADHRLRPEVATIHRAITGKDRP